MQPYKNLSGDSGVAFYENGPDYIKVQFKDNKTYVYTRRSVGFVHLAEMQRLAGSGMGLNTYINSHSEVKNGYESKY